MQLFGLLFLLYSKVTEVLYKFQNHDFVSYFGKYYRDKTLEKIQSAKDVVNAT